MAPTPARRKGCLIWAAGILGALFLLGVIVGPTPNMLPEVRSFLAQHQEFGKAISTSDVPNWARGKRQRVRFSGGPDPELLFYIEDGMVITVLRLSGPEKGRLVWGAYAKW